MDYGMYKIGKVADLMGITPEALRYYEREGVISPEKSPDSGYRQYSAWDIHILLRARSFRRYGFTMEETINTLSDATLEDTASLFKAQEIEIRNEINEKMLLLEELRHDRCLAEDALINIGKFRVEYRPAMHFIDVQIGYEILSDRFPLYKQWIEQVPYVASGGIFETHDGEEHLRFGLLVEDNNLARINVDALEGTDPLPSCLCLTTFFTSGSEKVLGLDMFKPALAYLDRHGLRQTGDPVARAVLMKNNGNSYSSWYKGWLPFEGETEYCLPVCE